MPTSHPYQLNEIVELVCLFDPKSLLDVGTGFGKFGFLAREYLELWDGRGQYGERTRRIDGVEAFAGYVLPHHRLVYDNLYVGDALEVLPKLETSYDLVLAADILEHFDYERGRQFLRACLNCGRSVIIATPLYVGPQGASFGNEYETHRFQWERRHLREFPNCVFIPHDSTLIACMGEDTARVRAGIRYGRWKPRLKRCFPGLVTLVLALKGRWRSR